MLRIVSHCYLHTKLLTYKSACENRKHNKQIFICRWHGKIAYQVTVSVWRCENLWTSITSQDVSSQPRIGLRSCVMLMKCKMLNILEERRGKFYRSNRAYQVLMPIFLAAFFSMFGSLSTKCEFCSFNNLCCLCDIFDVAIKILQVLTS